MSCQVRHPSIIGDINTVKGLEFPVHELMLTGERITNLKRLFSVRRGISHKDDTLSARILTQRLSSGGTRRNLFDLRAKLDEYYSVRGWSQDGIPTPDKLIEPGLEECL